MSRWPGLRWSTISFDGHWISRMPSSIETDVALLREVVERVGVDLADDHRLLVVDERLDRMARRARHVEPALEPDQHHRAIERADVARREVEHLGDVHGGQSASAPTTWSTERVSASTSDGSMAGNIPTRSWLRPSLRYASVSRMPLARSAVQTSFGVDRIVEVDRADHVRPLGRVRARTAWPTRATRPTRTGSRPTRRCDRPPSRGHRCRASSRAARRASPASPPPGCCRSGSWSSCRARSAGRATPDATGRELPISLIRSIAAGEQAASHSPPSDAKHFCGAK